MSSVTKINKEQLSTIASDLNTDSTILNGNVGDLASSLNEVESHNDFSSVTSKCSLISKSLVEIDKDLKYLANNINAYLETMIKIDSEGFDLNAKPEDNDTDKSIVQNNISSNISTSGSDRNHSSSNISTSISSRGDSTSIRPNYSYSSTPSGTIIHTSTNQSSSSNNSTSLFPSSNLTSEDTNVAPGGKYNYEGIEKYLESKNGITVEVPNGLGNIHTYMGWQLITSKSSNQYKLREAAGMKFDKEGFGKIGDRYVVATTTTFGNVGDFIDVYQEDGSVIKCVIGDIKNQNDAGCNKWGHNNGDCVIEFVVDKNTWYANGRGNHSNPGTSSCHPEWNQEITKVVNKGNFFDLIKTNAAKFDDEILEELLKTEEIIEV